MTKWRCPLLGQISIHKNFQLFVKSEERREGSLEWHLCCPKRILLMHKVRFSQPFSTQILKHCHFTQLKKEGWDQHRWRWSPPTNMRLIWSFRHWAGSKSLSPSNYDLKRPYGSSDCPKPSQGHKSNNPHGGLHGENASLRSENVFFVARSVWKTWEGFCLSKEIVSHISCQGAKTCVCCAILGVIISLSV